MIVYCEGIERGLDVRLLEAARDTLKRSGHPGAAVLDFRPSGSWTIVQQRLAVDREASHSNRAAKVQSVGLRDRDYLPRELVVQHRQQPGKRAFPLSRYSIESYLLEPALLAQDTGSDVAVVHQILSDEAWALRWRAAIDGAVDGYNRQHHRDLCRWDGPAPEDEPTAQAGLAAQLEALKDEVSEKAGHFDANRALAEMAADLVNDGPLWTRVEGRRLASQVAQRLDRGPNLRRILDLIETGQAAVPQALLADLSAALATWFPAPGA